MKELKNRRFGRLTVIGGPETFINSRNRKERKWLCRCDCGTEKYILERTLLYDGVKSCGCLARENSVKAIALDLQGETFGEITVLSVASDHPKDSRGGIWWHCRCSCGSELEVLASLLATGRKTHCGCKADPRYHTIDISGRKFDRLTAKYPLRERDAKGGVIWHCVCDCGNEVDLSYNVLMYSDIRSCGCWKRERESKLGEMLTHVDGTSIDMIKSKKIPKDNTTGYRGVYFIKGKYVAKIVFQKKQYNLGTYDNIEDAARARGEAEELLFDGTAEHYAKWKAKAANDPVWAEQNPVQIVVSKNDIGKLEVELLPKVI